MTCPKCGAASATKTSAYCHLCGTSLSDPEDMRVADLVIKALNRRDQKLVEIEMADRVMVLLKWRFIPAIAAILGILTFLGFSKFSDVESAFENKVQQREAAFDKKVQQQEDTLKPLLARAQNLEQQLQNAQTLPADVERLKKQMRETETALHDNSDLVTALFSQGQLESFQVLPDNKNPRAMRSSSSTTYYLALGYYPIPNTVQVQFRNESLARDHQREVGNVVVLRYTTGLPNIFEVAAEPIVVSYIANRKKDSNVVRALVSRDGRVYANGKLLPEMAVSGELTP